MVKEKSENSNKEVHKDSVADKCRNREEFKEHN